MNILHIFPSKYSGGSELCALESIRVLEKNGYQNYAIFPEDGSMVQKVSPHVKAYQIIENSWWMSDPAWRLILKIKMIKGFLVSALHIKKHIFSNHINLVITHTLVVPSGAIAAKMAGIPHIWYIHEYGDMDHQLKFNYGKKRTLSWVGFLSDKILVNSKALQQHFKQYFKRGKIEQLYYVVDYPLQQPMLSKEKDKLSVCMVGRIMAGKNQLIALQALALLKQENIFPAIVFVGGIEEKYKAVLDKFADENQLADQISYTGQTDTPWVYVQQADCILVCSKNEAFGRVTVEAMKSGKIAVVSDTGAGGEIVEDGHTGFLFNPDKATDLAAILKKIWQTEDIGSITKNAYDFSNEQFNESIHAVSLIQFITPYNK